MFLNVINICREIKWGSLRLNQKRKKLIFGIKDEEIMKKFCDLSNFLLTFFCFQRFFEF